MRSKGAGTAGELLLFRVTLADAVPIAVFSGMGQGVEDPKKEQEKKKCVVV